MTNTENTTVTEPVDNEPPADPTTANADQQEDTVPRPDAGRDAAKDAGKYRKQAREAEAERDTLRSRLETLQRQQVQTMAAEAGLQKPDAVWASGASLADCLDEDGQVDPLKARGIIQRSVDTLGLATAAPPTLDGGPRTPLAVRRGWSDVLRPNR